MLKRDGVFIKKKKGESGTIVCEGTPEEVAQVAASKTGQYLKRML